MYCEWYNTMTMFPPILSFMTFSCIPKSISTKGPLCSVVYLPFSRTSSQFASAGKVETLEPWRTMFRLNSSFNTFRKRLNSSRSPYAVSRSAKDKQWQIFLSSEVSYFLVFWEALQCNTIGVVAFWFDAFSLVMPNLRPRSAASWHEVDVNPFMSDIRRQDAAKRE